MTSGVTIRHLGRESEATAWGGDAHLQKLRQALRSQGFVLTSERQDRLVYGRPAALLKDDWPMRITVERQGRRFTIRYALCIPWPWIAGFVAAIVVVLPFAGLLRADMILVIATLAALLATYKQRFDCRPNAPFWQTAPRRRWGETMQATLEAAFAGG